MWFEKDNSKEWNNLNFFFITNQLSLEKKIAMSFYNLWLYVKGFKKAGEKQNNCPVK